MVRRADIGTCWHVIRSVTKGVLNLEDDINDSNGNSEESFFETVYFIQKQGLLQTVLKQEKVR